MPKKPDAPLGARGRVFCWNPSFLNDEESIGGFAVREKELTLLLETLRRNVGERNRHVLLLGPRGSGKTALLLRLAAELRTDPELRERWIPVLFGEESYGVLTLEDFWLEALFHASKERNAASAADADFLRLRCAWEELRKRGRGNVEDAALARLLDYGAARGKRILLLCENVGDMWGGGFSDDARRLRRTLETESGIAVVASATARFDKIDDASEAFFGFFGLMELKPLGARECARLWRAVAGEKIPFSQARALEILTGGNPRLLAGLAALGRDIPFSRLTDALEALIDAHTDYFKGRMEALPGKERKVFAALASMWRNAASGEVAEAARMDVRETSALLGRLVRRGFVSESGRTSAKRRGKTYRVADRLCSIYCLLRRGDEKMSVREILHFMTRLYERDLPALPTLGAEGTGAPEGTSAPGNPESSRAGLDRVFTECLRCLDREDAEEEGLELLAQLLGHRGFCVMHVAPVAHLLLLFAARSEALARCCLDLLENVPCGDVFIPLAAGLKERLGIPFEAPQEVREMAKDIRKWLERFEDGGPFVCDLKDLLP